MKEDAAAKRLREMSWRIDECLRRVLENPLIGTEVDTAEIRELVEETDHLQ